MTIAATPAKLKSGAWGARVAGTVNPGDVVTITSSSGRSWEAVVDRVLWSNAEISICATSSHARHFGLCRECGRAVKDAPHHRAMEGYCGECAFDEFDM